MNTLTLTKNEILNPQVSFEYFTDFARNFINKIESGEILTKKKIIFSEDTIRQYKVSIDHFEKFESKLDSRVKVYEINKRMLEAFEKHLYNENLVYNSVYLYISKIKALGNILFDEEISHRPVKFTTPKKETTQVSLSQQELKAMRNCDTLTQSEKTVLDIFLIQCFTGMRYSTLTQFLEQPMAYLYQAGDKTYIDIISKKTNEQSIIPLSKIVYELLNKYHFEFKTTSEEYLNRVIKIIGRKSGITKPIAKQITKNSETQTVIVPKWTLLKSHCGRRTFCTIAKTFITDNQAIIGMTGHKSEKQLSTYIRSEKLDRVLPIFENPFFNLEI